MPSSDANVRSVNSGSPEYSGDELAAIVVPLVNRRLIAGVGWRAVNNLARLGASNAHLVARPILEFFAFLTKGVRIIQGQSACLNIGHPLCPANGHWGGAQVALQQRSILRTSRSIVAWPGRSPLMRHERQLAQTIAGGLFGCGLGDILIRCFADISFRS